MSIDWESILIENGLKEFVEEFKEKGCDNISIWKNLDDFDLRQMGLRTKELTTWHENVTNLILVSLLN